MPAPPASEELTDDEQDLEKLFDITGKDIENMKDIIHGKFFNTLKTEGSVIE